jgi:hypothetical protein
MSPYITSVSLIGQGQFHKIRMDMFKGPSCDSLDETLEGARVKDCQNVGQASISFTMSTYQTEKYRKRQPINVTRFFPDNPSGTADQGQ